MQSEPTINDRIVIIGCGGHARSIADVILHKDSSAELLFVDENARPGERIMGFPVLASIPEEGGRLVLGIGDNARRRCLAGDTRYHTVIARTAVVSRFASIADGCFVGHGAHIGPEAVIGRGTVVNTNAVVEHEVHIGEFCHVAPNSVICGRSTIGSNVFIGAGASIKDSVAICSDVVIGAGAVIVKDIVTPGIYTGCPARLREVGNEISCHL